MSVAGISFIYLVQNQRQCQLPAVLLLVNEATVAPTSEVKILCITIDLVLRFNQDNTVLARPTARGISAGSLPAFCLHSASKTVMQRENSALDDWMLRLRQIKKKSAIRTVSRGVL